LRLITLQCSQIGFTLLRTFTNQLLAPGNDAAGDPSPRQTAPVGPRPSVTVSGQAAKRIVTGCPMQGGTPPNSMWLGEFREDLTHGVTNGRRTGHRSPDDDVARP